MADRHPGSGEEPSGGLGERDGAAATPPEEGPEPADADRRVERTEPSEVPGVSPVVEGVVSDTTGLQALVERSRQRLAAGQARLGEMIEQYHDRPALDVALRIYQRDREAAGTIVGSALAFRLFLFVVPLILFVTGLLGFLATWLDAGTVTETVGLRGTLARQVETALEQPNSTRWIATLVGLVGMVWAGRSLSKVMVSASCLSWRLPVTTKASARVIGSVVGLIVGMMLAWTIVNRVRRDLGLAVASLSFLAAAAIYALAWMVMSVLLPRATKDPGALLPGAAFVGSILAGMQAISQLYLPDKIGRASELYGAIAVSVVTLGWYFFLGRAMVLGMTLDAVVFERFGSISHVVFGLPLVRVLPRRSAWIRKVFDLQE
jgi:uncharacterized BrkB/YihY/UPF0761 family membrane protein